MFHTFILHISKKLFSHTSHVLFSHTFSLILYNKQHILELLTMLDDDIHETTGSVPPPPLPSNNSRQNSITVGVQGPG